MAPYALAKKLFRHKLNPEQMKDFNHSSNNCRGAWRKALSDF